MPIRRRADIVAVALVLLPMVSYAQQLRNVTGFDANLLVDKLCKGTFDTGGTGEQSIGAVHVRFFVKGNELAAESRSKFGEAAANATSGDPFGATGEMPAAVKDLYVSGMNVAFVAAAGGKWKLTYDKGILLGEVDPRGIKGREKWSVARARFVCE